MTVCKMMHELDVNLHINLIESSILSIYKQACGTRL